MALEVSILLKAARVPFGEPSCSEELAPEAPSCSSPESSPSSIAGPPSLVSAISMGARPRRRQRMITMFSALTPTTPRQSTGKP